MNPKPMLDHTGLNGSHTPRPSLQGMGIDLRHCSR
jgi:hypothetical protein